MATSSHHPFTLDLHQLHNLHFQDFTPSTSYYSFPYNDKEQEGLDIDVTSDTFNRPSLTTTTHSATSSTDSTTVTNSTTSNTNLATQMPFLPSGASAPLPSPVAPSSSAGHRNSYFSYPPQTAQMQQQSQFEQQHQQLLLQQQQQQQQSQRQQYIPQHQHSQRGGYPYQTQHRQDSTSSTSSDASAGGGLDFGLLAEAAKRAQMACVMRDMADMGL